MTMSADDPYSRDEWRLLFERLRHANSSDGASSPWRNRYGSTFVGWDPGGHTNTVRPPARAPAEPLSASDAADQKIAELEAEVKRLKRKCNRTIDQMNRFQSEAIRLRQQVTQLRVSQERGQHPPVGDLLQLCHPDRHVEALQELANKVTVCLLEIRRKAR